jgi:hypothetical protein
MILYVGDKYNIRKITNLFLYLKVCPFLYNFHSIKENEDLVK